MNWSVPDIQLILNCRFRSRTANSALMRIIKHQGIMHDPSGRHARTQQLSLSVEDDLRLISENRSRHVVLFIATFRRKTARDADIGSPRSASCKQLGSGCNSYRVTSGYLVNELPAISERLQAHQRAVVCPTRVCHGSIAHPKETAKQSRRALGENKTDIGSGTNFMGERILVSLGIRHSPLAWFSYYRSVRSGLI